MAARKPIEVQLSKPKHPALEPAYSLLDYGRASVKSLASLYAERTKKRGPGAPTHEEQDLLRAMVVMAGAALDATLKRILTDAYNMVLTTSDKAYEQAVDHVHRRILRQVGEAGGKRMAAALLSDDPRAKLAEQIVDDVTGQSLQSVEEIDRVRQYLGVSDDFLRPIRDSLREALSVRNQVVHEMDAMSGVRGKPGFKKRRQRKKDEMTNYAQVLLQVGAELIKQVDSVLSGSRGDDD